jgi:menaquinone-specific isochorismate synthase
MNPVAPSAPASESPALEQVLGDALGRSERDAEFVAITLQAPSLPAEAFLSGIRDDLLAFAPPAGFECAGIGVCASVVGSGPERFALVERRAEALFGRISSVGAGAPAQAPRLLGGFAFQVGRAESALWNAFGEARFVLPRLLYTRNSAAATLSLCVRREELERQASRRSLGLELEHALARLSAQTASAARLPQVRGWSPAAALGGEGALDWVSSVQAIRREIESGRLEKVVLARRVELDLGELPEAAQVLSRLRAQAPECTRFVLRTAEHTFVGAAPERLVKKQGSAFETEAVAGSMKAEEPLVASRLLESEKDLLEHEMVVRGIVAALAPIAAELDYPRRPELHRLRHVLHLRTPIRGRLLGSAHVLSLVERLHPTPAVGGLPSDAALDWIAAHEPDERGWYAGPIGWFDAAGDGEFVVALRSGVLADRRAHLYVGAGIVQGSVPLEEFAETQWKLAALSGALGVKP